MTGHYILNEKREAVQVDLETWARFFDSGDFEKTRRVNDSNVNDVRISTVFLGTNYNFYEGAPLLFETMCFGGEFDQDCERYSTWEEAEEGHKAKVKQVLKAREGNYEYRF